MKIVPHPVNKTLKEPFGCVDTSAHLFLILSWRQRLKNQGSVTHILLKPSNLRLK